MSKIRVAAFSISLDGYAAGPEQSLENPLGKRGTELHHWFFDTRAFKAMHSGGDDASGTAPAADEAFAEAAMANAGAFIMGRNMFGPIRGGWTDDSWKGWWGDNPPYHAPVFVLTHHPRAPLVMEGGTTFHFITAGIHAALEQAREAAGSADIRIGGGVSTIRQYLQANLIDELHLAISPVLLGQGENLLSGIDLPALGFRVTTHTPSVKTIHVVLQRG